MTITELEVKCRYLITNKNWGDRVFEIYVDEISPSGNWIKISEIGKDTKGRNKPSRWYNKDLVKFHEKLERINIQDESVEDIEDSLE